MSSTFRPPWWATLLLLAGLVIFCSAGFWQLDRAAQKQQLHEEYARNTTTAPRRGLPPDGAAGEARFSRVELAGRFDPGRQVLLDNLTAGGRAGYQVLTPFETGDGWVLVNRGFVPADGNRALLPDITVSGTERVITGRIARLPVPGMTLKTPAPPADAPWPRRLLFPTVPDISAQTGLRLRDYQVLLDPGEADGYLRDWKPGGMGPELHRGYAVQWFGLALTAVVIYIVLTLKYSGGSR